MLKIEDIRVGNRINGIIPNESVAVISANLLGDSLQIVYRTPSGHVEERLLFKTDEQNLYLASSDSRPTFKGDQNRFKLAAEAYRIKLAHLFDPLMAVHTSKIDPLPHQITGVYETMLPRQPLRFVLADDPGAGKTIMAGLLIRELMVRGDLKKCLIITPGSLVEQWQDEMDEKFNLAFDIFSAEMAGMSRTGNPFIEKDCLIARIDQLSRNEDYQEKLKQSYWDLIIVDEAHKMSANWFGSKINKTKRYNLGELVGGLTRHFLLMTATPHNGKQEDYQAFLALLDSDRFYGKERDGAHQIDTSDLMRRMMKEELVKFDGTPLFPERRAETIKYELSEQENQLYEEVTKYVVDEMNKADRLDDKRKGTVGFALTILQRRLASSPEAIYKSLERRLKKLINKIDEAKMYKNVEGVKPGTVEEIQIENFEDVAVPPKQWTL